MNYQPLWLWETDGNLETDPKCCAIIPGQLQSILDDLNAIRNINLHKYPPPQPTHHRILQPQFIIVAPEERLEHTVNGHSRPKLFWAVKNELPTVVVWCVSSLLNVIWLFFYTVEQGACITVAYPTRQMLMNLHIWVDLGDLNSVVWKICLLVPGQHLLLCQQNLFWQLYSVNLGDDWLLFVCFYLIAHFRKQR